MKNSTIRDFAKFSISNGPVAELKISQDRKDRLISHIFQEGGTSLVKIKKDLPEFFAKKVSELGSAKNRNKVIGSATLPLELIVTYAGAQILENVNSVMIENSSCEKDRLSNAVEAAIMIVETNSDEYSSDRKNLIEKYVSKFERCGRITPSLEGIVFNWKNNPYKITGNFAPINHILGIPRYGRGKIPPIGDQNTINEVANDISFT